jgi:hypothetical protein
VKPKLCQQIMAKLASQLEGIAAVIGDKPIPKGRMTRGLLKSGVLRGLETQLRRASDKRFEKIMANLDGLNPDTFRKSLKAFVTLMPKNRGGRPATFSLDIRRRAVQDVGHEYPRCDSLAQAIELVAARHGMTTEYLRKVWKNRKRLRQHENEMKDIGRQGNS